MSFRPPSDALPLERFEEEGHTVLQRLKRTHAALLITRDGKPEAVVQSLEDYQRMAELAEHAENIAGIRRGLEEVQRGETIDAFEALDQMKRELNIPDPE